MVAFTVGSYMRTFTTAATTTPLTPPGGAAPSLFIAQRLQAFGAETVCTFPRAATSPSRDALRGKRHISAAAAHLGVFSVYRLSFSHSQNKSGVCIFTYQRGGVVFGSGGRKGFCSGNLPATVDGLKNWCG